MNNEDSEIRIARLEQSLLEMTRRFEELEARLTPPPTPQSTPHSFTVPPVLPSVPIAPVVPEASTVAPQSASSQPILSSSPDAASAPTPTGSVSIPPVVDHGYSMGSKYREMTEARQYTPPPVANPDDLEYKFGINGLLRGGAIVILVAFLFLAAVMITRGYVTPQIQFIGELALCLGFVGIGLWKRDEKEEFGQLMVGLGSAGMYASFAGAHLYKHLFEGETLVVLFILLSAANLGFATWRSSKSFLTLGMMGGFAAALMPMQKGQVVLDLCLHFLILIPCALIIIKNRWNGFAGLMWVASSLALLPATTSASDQVLRVGAIYLNCAVALYACGKVFKPTEFDRYGAIQSAILFFSGLMAIGIDSGQKGSLHVAALAVIGLAIGQLFSQDNKAKYATWFGALLVFAILMPLGFAPRNAAFLFGLESIILASLALRLGWLAFGTVGLLTLSLGVGAYVTDYGLSRVWKIPSLEILLLLGLSVSVVLHVMYVLRKGSKELGELALFVGGMALTGSLIRTTSLALPQTGLQMSLIDAALVGLSMASIATILFAGRIRRSGMYMVSGMVGTTAGVLALVRDSAFAPQWVTVVALFASAITVVFATKEFIREENKPFERDIYVAAGLLLSSIFVRVLQVAGTHKFLTFTSESIIYLAFGILNIVWTGLALGTRKSSYVILGWISFMVLGASALGLETLGTMSWFRPMMLLVATLSLGILYVITPRKEMEEGMVTALSILAGWVLTTFLISGELVRPWIGFNQVSAITISWVAFAVFLIVTGFKWDRRFLRYGSLLIFAVSSFKVFLVDLAALDSMIRVGILMFLGLGMVGGGYWYILWRRRAQQ